ncbi:unnamed protein product, partial [Rotaria magnacalcarata]
AQSTTVSETVPPPVSDPKTHVILKPEQSPALNSKPPTVSEAHPPQLSEKN